jgi:hypothetical protein
LVKICCAHSLLCWPKTAGKPLGRFSHPTFFPDGVHQEAVGGQMQLALKLSFQSKADGREKTAPPQAKAGQVVWSWLFPA